MVASITQLQGKMLPRQTFQLHLIVSVLYNISILFVRGRGGR